jgi:hypothetical protein
VTAPPGPDPLGGAPAGARAQPNGHAPPGGGVDGKNLAEALASAGEGVREVLAYLKTLLAVRADRARISARRTAGALVLGALGAIAGTAILVSAGIALVVGVSGGLAALFGGIEWLGSLLAGLLFLGGAALAVKLALSRREREEFEKRKAKYERARRDHRERFGQHADDLAPAAQRGGAAGPGGGPRAPGAPT